MGADQDPLAGASIRPSTTPKSPSRRSGSRAG
ncbi:hypothetical protein SAMN05428944_5085 [Streptomyces sp. 1222.5]|nr:hypothetical protein BX260_3012 [Streptomyces sp. 5112.2]SEC78685.1 hypothetical protein SAMN05428944_5085 [Streptomyces sp. 1222.5]